jgi:hypothetical protein
MHADPHEGKSRFVTGMTGARNMVPGARGRLIKQPLIVRRWHLSLCRVKETGAPPAILASITPVESVTPPRLYFILTLGKTLEVPFLYLLPFVKHLFAFTDTKLDLKAPIYKIKP